MPDKTGRISSAKKRGLLSAIPGLAEVPLNDGGDLWGERAFPEAGPYPGDEEDRKFCTGPCGRLLPPGEFYGRYDGYTGTHTKCKECRKAQVAKWNAEHYGAVKDRSATYYERHKEEKRAYNADYYERNKARLAAKARERKGDKEDVDERTAS